MIEAKDKPTAWEDGYRRASVWPNVLCFVGIGRGGGITWNVQMGLPGICVDYEMGDAATLNEAHASADRVAAKMIAAVMERMAEALAAMPNVPT